jgi:hypothetical protein
LIELPTPVVCDLDFIRRFAVKLVKNDFSFKILISCCDKTITFTQGIEIWQPGEKSAVSATNYSSFKS